MLYISFPHFFIVADQAPQYDPSLVGSWVLVALAIVGTAIGIAVGIKNLTSLPMHKEAVAHKDFDDFKKAAEKKLEVLEEVINSLYEKNELSSRGFTKEVEANFKLINRDIEDIRNKMVEAVKKQEFDAVIKAIDVQRSAMVERMNDMRLHMEAMHRNINVDVQNLIGKLADKLERNHQNLLSLYNAGLRQFKHIAEAPDDE